MAPVADAAGLKGKRSRSLRGKAALVTGATGLVGGHLVPRLVACGARVVALIRDEEPRAFVLGRPEWGKVVKVRGDILDGPLMTRLLHDYDISYVYHLAAQTQVGVAWRHPADSFENNLRSVWLMMEAARSRHGATSIMLASSDKAYGPSASLPYTEAHPHRPTHPYDTSKSCAEAVARSYHHSYDIPLVMTRCGNLYGPGDLNLDRLVPSALLSLIRGERPIIRSDGTPQRDYVYVEDAVGAMLALTTQLPRWDGRAFNIGSGRPTSVLELVTAIARAAGQGDLEPDVRGEAVGELQAQYLDSTRIKEAVGWVATTSLEAGLAKTAPWYRALVAGGLVRYGNGN